MITLRYAGFSYALKIFFGGITERDTQRNIIVQRIQINGNLSNHDSPSSYFYTYLLSPIVERIPYINNTAQLLNF